MKIGFNLLFLLPSKVGGTETYTRGLLSSLEENDNKNQYFLFTNRENEKTFSLNSNRFHKVRCFLFASFRPLRILYEQLALPFQVRSSKIDLLISLGYTSPLFLPCRFMVFIYDLNWFFHPEEFSFLSRLILRVLVTFSAKRASFIMTTSESSKKDLVSVLKIPPEKIGVLPGGIDSSLLKKREKVSLKKDREKFVFCVSPSYRFKNLPSLVKAFKMFKKDFPDFKLLIAGLKGKGQKDLENEIRKLSLEKEVFLLGWVSESELSFLYSRASLYVHPSLYEGFGFPVLEAMDLGCPVVCSRSSSLPEVVGEAAMIVNAQKPLEIYQGMVKVLKSKKIQEELVLKGLKRARQFTWEKTTQKLLEYTL